jgi:hypothetical protein
MGTYADSFDLEQPMPIKPLLRSPIPALTALIDLRPKPCGWVVPRLLRSGVGELLIVVAAIPFGAVNFSAAFNGTCTLGHSHS